MSGIAGIFNLDGRPIDHALLTRMTDAIAHRGPDGIHHWTNGPVGLGHCMSHTTPESVRETQPFIDESATLTLVLDGRVDNRKELRAALDAKGMTLRTDTDAELVLKAYECWGENSPQRLVGDFSFAIWDWRSRRLFCSRDRLGVKPFFYCFLPGRLFAFASEIRSLLALPDLPQRLNEWMITEMFEPVFEGFDKTATFYMDILKLEPATRMSVRDNLSERRRYWSLDASREIRLRSDGEYVERFREIFTESVRCRMRATGPIGITLSGGIDSSSVVCTASRLAEETGVQVHTFSGTAERDCPENRFINAVLKNVSVCPHVIRSDEARQYADDFERVIFNASEPTEPTDGYLTRILFRLAQQNSVRVIMSGVDGDMATSIRYPIPYLVREGKWIQAISQCRDVAVRQNWSTFQVIRSFLLRPFAPQFALRIWDKIRGNESSSLHLFNKEYASRIELSRRMKLLQQEWFKLKHDARQDHADFVSCGILPHAYEQQDLIAADMGVEVRHPFSDHRLIEFCLGVPSEQKVQNGYPKALLRRAADIRLPDDVRWRVDKPSVGPHFIRSLLSAKRELFEEALLQLDIIGDYVDIEKLQSIRRRYDPENNWLGYYVLLSAMSLMLWLGRVRFAKIAGAY